MRVPHFRPPLRARMRHDIVLVGCFSCWLFLVRKLELELLAKKLQNVPVLMSSGICFENVGPFLGSGLGDLVGRNFW